MDNAYGTLYVCATPIGNMGDITLRALEALKNADVIAAEDTRRTLKLLNRYGIKKRLISCHEHNEAAKSAYLLSLLAEGKSIALVSDAGTPCVSDPGGIVISECINAGVRVEVCPGASAAITALTLSGLDSARFAFEGFLPRKAKERKARLAALKNEPRTVIIYEAPHRLIKSLNELIEHLGDRRVAIAREMTKIHEEVIRGNLSETVRFFTENPPKGEFVLVLEGAGDTASDGGEGVERGYTAEERVKHYIKEGFSEMDAIKKTAKDMGVPKRKVYEEVKCKTS